jgi:plasmid stability protein
MPTPTGPAKRPLVALPEDVHKALKIYAAQHNSQVKKLVEVAVRDFMKRQGIVPAPTPGAH